MFTNTHICQKISSRLINRSIYSNENIIPKSRSKIIKAKKKQTLTSMDVEKPVSKPRSEIIQMVDERKGEAEIKNEEDELRVNEVNIQMLSKNIYNQLFSSAKSSVENSVIEACRADLRKHNIDYTQCDRLPDVRLRLPPLQGSDILEHFRNIGEHQAAPYRTLLQEMATCQLPARPSHWLMEPGWFQYSGAGPPQRVPYPPDDALVFDVEVCMSVGSQPTLATAVSKDCWYGWVSQALIDDRVQERGVGNVVSYDDLIPLMSPAGTPVATSLSDVTEEQKRPRIVIGHNVSYDRIRVKEQYWMPRTGMRFWDTMSMHVCVSGVTSYQRALLKAKEKPVGMEDYDWMEMASLNSLTEVHKLYCGSELSKEARNTFVEGSLADVRADFQQLMAYCSGDVAATAAVLHRLLPLFLERFPHPVTLAGMLELGTAYLPVNCNWLQYLESSELAFEERKLEARQLLSRRAEKACRLQHRERYRGDLWMWDQDWSTQALRLKKDTRQTAGEKGERQEEDEWKEASVGVEGEVLELEGGGRLELVDEQFVRVVTGQSQKSKSPEKDEPTLEAEFSGLLAKGALLPVKRPHLPGYPAWFRKLCDKPILDEHWTPGPHNITTGVQVTPKLLSLSWSGYPLHFIRGEGWGYLVPTAAARPEDYVPDGSPQVPLESLLRACPMKGAASMKREEMDMARLGKGVEQDISKREYYALKKNVPRDHEITESCAPRGVALQDCAELVRLPHKDGRASRVGNPLARDFLNLFSQKVLCGKGEEAEKVLMLARMTSYWRNNRERITEQQVVWLNRDGALQHGAILPQVAVCGTLTRRAMEATWMTASNAHAERVGSELRAMVQAPPGYHFVGADVDSQELWIASLLGDSGCGVHGGTPLGWAVLAGAKSRGTDLHSLTARAIAISRDHAKVINYARIYGAGQNFAEQLLKQFNASLTSTEARSKAAKMFSTTKGRRAYTMKSHVAEELGHEVPQRVSAWEARRLAGLCGRPVEEMFERPLWVGGTESAMFNKLEEIADAEDAHTSFLHGRMSRALEGAAGRWAPTRINWAVQSGAADFLHLLLVNMRWLGGDVIRFSLSFHDEVRYLVPEEMRYEAALALHITNLYTRAFCAQSVGLQDLPQSVAFFTSVEVDRALRKEARAEYVTPSNPLGLRAGYGLAPGETLDVKQASDLCDASLRRLYHE